MASCSSCESRLFSDIKPFVSSSPFFANNCYLCSSTWDCSSTFYCFNVKLSASQTWSLETSSCYLAFSSLNALFSYTSSINCFSFDCMSAYYNLEDSCTTCSCFYSLDICCSLLSIANFISPKLCWDLLSCSMCSFSSSFSDYKL